MSDQKMYETFEFMGHRFDINKALELIETNAIKYNKSSLNNYEEWAKSILAVDCYELVNNEYVRKEGRCPLFRYDPNVAMKLPAEVLDKPMIMVKDPKGNHLLIDGYHRLFRAFADKRVPEVIIISDKKAIKQFYDHHPSQVDMFAPVRKKNAGVSR